MCKTEVQAPLELYSNSYFICYHTYVSRFSPVTYLFFLSSILILSSSFLLLSFLLLSFSPPQAVKCITCSNSLCLFTDDVESDSEEASGQNGESDFVSSLLFKLSVVVSFTFMCVCVFPHPVWPGDGVLLERSVEHHRWDIRQLSDVPQLSWDGSLPGMPEGQNTSAVVITCHYLPAFSHC